MNKALLFSFLLWSTVVALGQVPTKRWDRTLGGSAIDEATCVVQTPDNGFLVGGFSASGNNGNRTAATNGGNDFWVVKLDASGTKQWDKAFGGSGNETLNSIVAMPDGGFILVGLSDSNSSGDKTEASRGLKDYWLVKIDASGNKLWDKTFGGTSNDYGFAAVLTSDSGVVVVGSTTSGLNGDKTEASRGGYDFWIIKVTGSGVKVWDKTIGGSSVDEAYSVAASSDGGFIVAGYSMSNISGDKTEAGRGVEDIWAVKLSASGTKVWDKTVGGSGYDYAQDVCTTADGGFLLAGYSASNAGGDKTANRTGSEDCWLVKLSTTGSKVWDKTVGGNSYDRAYSVTTDTDGGFTFAGISGSDTGGDKTDSRRGAADYWIVKLTASGSKVWDKTLGGVADDYASAIISTTDGGFMIVGSSNSVPNSDKTENSLGSTDYWVTRLDAPSVPCVSATATLTGSQTIAAGNSATLTVAFSGDAPYSLTLNNGQAYTNVSVSPLTITVTPASSTTYTISQIANACGTGIGTGTAIVSVQLCSQMYSVKSGSWNDPTVWSCNRVPTLTDSILVSASHIITMPTGTTSTSSQLKAIGQLVFPTESLLRVGF